MPFQPSMKLLSEDDHLIEHPRVWTDSLLSKFVEAGPRIKELPRAGMPPMQSWVSNSQHGTCDDVAGSLSDLFAKR